MPDVKRDMEIDDVAAVVNSEGIGYAIQNYLNSKRIANKELREEWQKAYAAIIKIKELLGDKLEI